MGREGQRGAERGRGGTEGQRGAQRGTEGHHVPRTTHRRTRTAHAYAHRAPCTAVPSLCCLPCVRLVQLVMFLCDCLGGVPSCAAGDEAVVDAAAQGVLATDALHDRLVALCVTVAAADLEFAVSHMVLELGARPRGWGRPRWEGSILEHSGT